MLLALFVLLRLIGSGGHLEALSPLQRRPAHACVLGGYRHYRAPVAAPLGQAARPTAEAVLLGRSGVHGGSEDRPRAHDEQAAQVGVSCLGDSPQALFAARAVLARHQAQPGAEAAPASEVVATADGAEDGRGGGLANARQLHQLLRLRAVAGHEGDVAVILSDAFIQPCDFAKQVTDHRVGPAGQVFEVGQRFAPYDGGLQGQHNAEFRQQPPDAVEGGGALFHETLAGAVHHQLALLFDGLEGYEAHLGPGDGFTNRCCVCGVVLAAFARKAVGGDELGGHQAHSVAELLEFPGPVVCAGARFHTDEARGHGGKAAMSSSSLSRATLGRTRAGLPAASTL